MSEVLSSVDTVTPMVQEATASSSVAQAQRLFELLLKENAQIRYELGVRVTSHDQLLGACLHNLTEVEKKVAELEKRNRELEEENKNLRALLGEAEQAMILGELACRFHETLILMVLSPERKKQLRTNTLKQLLEDVAESRLTEDEHRSFLSLTEQWKEHNYPQLHLVERSLAQLKYQRNTRGHPQLPPFSILMAIFAKVRDLYAEEVCDDVDFVVKYLREQGVIKSE